MIYKILRGFISLLGFAIGVLAGKLLEAYDLITFPKGPLDLIIPLIVGLIFAIILFLLSPHIIKKIKKFASSVEFELGKVPTQDIVLGSLGLIIGLIIAFFISQPIYQIPYVGPILVGLVYIILAYLSIKISIKSKADFVAFFNRARENREKNKEQSLYKEGPGESSYKILDTSVIIDGRIAGIIKAGFIEGQLVIPNFVLLELQHIADSADDLKRERGRRGLDILKEIQDQNQVDVIISQKTYDNIEEVDSKLLALTEDLGGKVITNDFNLNKVAEVRGIKVLNINDLANAVKAPVMHGEIINVKIIKEGSEEGQGIGYLNDGTMVVVESGKDHLGDNVKVEVTSVIQTSAGKMIFTKLKQA